MGEAAALPKSLCSHGKLGGAQGHSPEPKPFKHIVPPQLQESPTNQLLHWALHVVQQSLNPWLGLDFPCFLKNRILPSVSRKGT